MAVLVSFRADRKLPPSLARSPLMPESVAIDLFDRDRLEEAVSTIEKLGGAILSAISITPDIDFVGGGQDVDPEWVAAAVTSDNHEWLAGETYTWPFDWTNQRIPSGDPLRVYNTPKGNFSKLGFQFGARAPFWSFVDAMPESFEYSTGRVIRKGKVLDGWARVEPVRELRLLSADSLGSLSTTFHPRPYRATLLWMGTRIPGDFGFVWDELPHGWFEQQRCALVPVQTGRKLMKRFPGSFLAEPVFDVESPTAKRAVEVYRLLRQRLPMRGWC